MKRGLLLFCILILPLVSLGQIVEPIPKIVINKLESIVKDSFPKASPKLQYVIPKHKLKPIEYTGIEKEPKNTNIGLNNTHLKNKTKQGILLKKSLLKLEDDNLIGKNISVSIRRHSFGFGVGFLFSFLDDIGGTPPYITYKYSINLNKKTNLLFIQAGYYWFKRPYDNIKSQNIINLELGFQMRSKDWLDLTGFYAATGMATSIINSYGPLYVKENNKLIKKKGEQKQYLTAKLGWGGEVIKNLTMNFDFSYFHNFKNACYEKYWGSINSQFIYHINKNK